MQIRKTTAPALIALLVLVNSCGGKYGYEPPYPTFILQYQSSKGNYDQFYTYNSTSYNSSGANTTPLSGSAFVNYDPLSDSMMISYTSYLATGSGPGRVMTITINKKFPISILDSANGQWFPNNSADFLNVFNLGKVSLGSLNQIAEGAVIELNPGSQYLYDLPGPLAEPDPSNDIEIVNATSNVLWYDLNGVNSSGVYSNAPQIMVTFNIRGKFYNNNNPNDTLVMTQSTYQGYFIEYNPY